MVNDLKNKLGKTERIGEVESYLYIADDSEYLTVENNQIDYQQLLLEKEHQIRELEVKIESYQRKLRDFGYKDELPKVYFS